jgi:transcriptional/translational regulatory protein YebC/TACO1
MAPVKFMFERYGRVAVSIAKSHEADLVNRILDIGIERGASEVKQSEVSETSLTMEVINYFNGKVHSKADGYYATFSFFVNQDFLDN